MKIKTTLIVFFFIILGLTIIYGIAFIYPFEPCGKYRDEKISASGLAYMEFKGSITYLVVHLGPDMQSRILDKMIIGTYAKQNNRWIYYPKGASSGMLIKSTFFAIEISEMNNNMTEKHSRIFLNY